MESPIQAVIDEQRLYWGDKIFDVMQEIATLEDTGMLAARGILRDTPCGPVTVVAVTFYPNQGENEGVDHG